LSLGHIALGGPNGVVRAEYLSSVQKCGAVFVAQIDHEQAVIVGVDVADDGSPFSLSKGSRPKDLNIPYHAAGDVQHCG